MWNTYMSSLIAYPAHIAPPAKAHQDMMVAAYRTALRHDNATWCPLHMLSALGAAIAEPGALTALALEGCGLTSALLACLCSGFGTSPLRLSELSLRDNTIECMDGLASLLRTPGCALESLDVRGNKLQV